MRRMREKWQFESSVFEKERMSETGRGKKRNRKKKERDIILMRGGNKKYYLSLALSYSAQP